MPTLFENYAAEIESRQGIVQVSMYDTPGDDNYSHIRPLSYPDTDIILLCFDLSSPISYQNIFTKVRDAFCRHVTYQGAGGIPSV